MLSGGSLMNTIYGIGAALAVTLLAAPAFAQSLGTGSANSTALIIRPIAVSAGGTLGFGTLVRGAGTAAVDSSGVRTVTGSGVALAATTPSNADFSVSGEGGQLVTVTVGSLNLANATSGNSSDNLPVTLTATNTGSQTLSGALGASGVLDVAV